MRVTDNSVEAYFLLDHSVYMLPYIHVTQTLIAHQRSTVVNLTRI